MKLTLAEMKRALRNSRKRRKPQMHEEQDLGKVWITERAVQTYYNHLPAGSVDIDAAKRDIAVHAFRHWQARLRFKEVGQSECILPGFRLHFAIDSDCQIYADVEPWFAY